ncbi:MAG TPA: transposase [Clostridiaceae bacterium]|nr:transposase [Clostridiaceae bacterium]
MDGLCAIVQENYGKELKTDDLFLFRGQRTDWIKSLL